MRKLSAKCVPKCLNADRKRQRCHLSEQLLELFRLDPNDFLSRLVTVEETWLYHYDPETNQQSMEWRRSVSPRPKKFRVQKSAGKVSPIFLGGSRRHPPHWFPSKRPNYQRGILLISAGAIEGHFEGKTPREGHQVGRVLAKQFPGSPGTCNLEETGLPDFQCLDHPPYSTDVAPSDYHLFPGLKKQLKSRHFSSDVEVIAAA